MKKILIASIAAGAMVVSLAAPASGGLVEPVGLVYAPHDCETPKIEPKRIVLACGDANAYVGKVKWSEWGGEKAKGEGWFYLNNCKPNCAEGDFISYGAKVKLKEIEADATCGGQTVDLYTHAKVRFIGEVPPGRHLRNWDLDCNS
jgi:hypothetical protein